VPEEAVAARLVGAVGIGVVTVKAKPLLKTPPTLTRTLPVVALLGTVATMLVALQLVAAVGVPLNEIVLVPCVVPKFVPLIVTEIPTGPEDGFKPVMFGVGTTVNGTALLASAPTVTMIFPVVAPLGTGTSMLNELHLVGLPGVPLNVIVLVPCDAPKLVPTKVTRVPAAPDEGATLVIFGKIVKFRPLLTTPPTVTVTLPVVTPYGTGTTILVGPQLVMDGATKPLKLTKLDD